MSDWLDQITQAPPDAVFGVAAAFREDEHPDKVNLSVGAYRDENGQPWVLPVVKKAEELILAKNLNHEYLPQIGLAELRQAGPVLLFGKNSAVLPRVACVQSLSGTGALRVVGEFLKQFHPSQRVYVTEPTWSNHSTIFTKCGFQVDKLRYFDAKTRGLAIEHLLEDVEQAPEQSILILHSCAHNPTGVDPTAEQWAQIEAVVRRRRHTVVFDTAYQGYASGDLDRDAGALRSFAEAGHEVLVCQSFAKNMGLYGERVGTVSVVCKSADKVKAVESRLEKIIRPMYSNPPKHGALVASLVMQTPELYEQWLKELRHMSDRIITMRTQLKEALVKLGTPGNWDHITSQIGMFSYTGLTKDQVDHIIKHHHVYLLGSGRISMAGLNEKNLSKVAAAMDDAVRQVPAKL